MPDKIIKISDTRMGIESTTVKTTELSLDQVNTLLEMQKKKLIDSQIHFDLNKVQIQSEIDRYTDIIDQAIALGIKSARP